MKLNLFIGFEDYSDTTIYFMNSENDEAFKFIFDKEPIYIDFDQNNQIVLKSASLILSSEEQAAPDSEHAVDIFPNPADHELTISIHSANNSEARISLFDITGKPILNSSSNDVSKRMHQFNLETSVLESGIYFVRIEIGGELISRKIVINH
jgi:hypothetical protein